MTTGVHVNPWGAAIFFCCWGGAVKEEGLGVWTPPLSPHPTPTGLQLLKRTLGVPQWHGLQWHGLHPPGQSLHQGPQNVHLHAHVHLNLARLHCLVQQLEEPGTADTALRNLLATWQLQGTLLPGDHLAAVSGEDHLLRLGSNVQQLLMEPQLLQHYEHLAEIMKIGMQEGSGGWLGGEEKAGHYNQEEGTEEG